MLPRETIIAGMGRRHRKPNTLHEQERMLHLLLAITHKLHTNMEDQ